MSLVLTIALIYLACGLIFGIPFVIKGVQRIDEGAHGAGIGFRILILPGVMAFWPFLLKKWIQTGKEARHD
jgi:hypothetical protein